MKIKKTGLVYLVGGAVRDQLLNYPVTERDWVVVGSTPEALIAQGYRSVGRDFPVFLHPETKEEYALARTERKQGHGYRGFVTNYNPLVTLEEDLLRRDLTINAMAMDELGNIVDPYGGQADIAARCLRHVSPAFSEDPVRVLRVARLMARYVHMGFHVAEETACLMRKMVQNGDLEHLVAERVWQEWEKSLREPHPQLFIETLRSVGALRVILPELDALFGVPNALQYHPEVDSGIHSMQLLEAVSQLTQDSQVRFAALVHDVGKGVTPIGNWPRHVGHEHYGIPVLEKFCQRLKVPNEYRQLAILVIKYHLLALQGPALHPNTIVDMLCALDAFRRPERFKQWLFACECNISQRSFWLSMYEACCEVNTKQWVTEELSGERIKQNIANVRLQNIKKILKTYNNY